MSQGQPSSANFELIGNIHLTPKTSTQSISRLFTRKHEILIISGGMVNGDHRSVLLTFVDQAVKVYKKVVYVPSLYEYQSKVYTIDQINNYFKRLGTMYLNFIPLIDSTLVLPSLRVLIIGSTLWQRVESSKLLHTFEKIKIASNKPITGLDINMLHYKSLKSIIDAIDSVNGKGYQCFVFTTLPFESLIHDNGRYVSSEYDQIVRSHHIQYWYFGRCPKTQQPISYIHQV